MFKDGRNRSRFAWMHLVRITSRHGRPLPTIVDLTEADPLTGKGPRPMADELELVHGRFRGKRGGVTGPTQDTHAGVADTVRSHWPPFWT